MFRLLLVLSIVLIWCSATGNAKDTTTSSNVDMTKALNNVLGSVNNTNMTQVFDNALGTLNDPNTTNALGNVATILSKLLETGSSQGMTGIVQTIEELIQGAADNGNLALGLSGNKTDGAANIQSLLASLVPLLSKAGLSDPTNLVPMAVDYLRSSMYSLAKKGVSESCRNDLYMWATGLQTFQGWAWKMIDSGFKIPSNLAGFNLKDMGDMGECIAIHASSYNNLTRSMQEFDGKYCRQFIPIPGIPEKAGFPGILLGFCAPSHCSNSDMKIIVDSALEAVVPKTFASMLFTSCIEETELGSKAIAVICFLALLGGVVTIATIYDIVTIQLKSDDDEPNSHKLQQDEEVNMKTVNTNSANAEAEKDLLPVKEDFGTSTHDGAILTPDFSITNKQKGEQSRKVKAVLAFSVYTNARKLLGTSQTSGSLSAVYGIRFLSMAWIILGHTFTFAEWFAANTFDFRKNKRDQYSFMAILYANPSVDSFFAVSGCLVAYLTLRELKKVGGAKKLNWFMFYFHRFWRLTPPYMLILLVATILYRYIGNGAFKPDGDSIAMASCRDNWWTNLLYINNFLNTDKMCMGWSWYLADDMQMYILSPLIFLPLFYNVIAGGVVTAIFMICTIIATAVISHTNQYSVQSESPFAPTKPDENHFLVMYIPFYTRMGPYIVGLITGYILYKRDCKFRIPKFINLGCWLLCVLITTVIIYGPYTKADSHIMSIDESTAYNALFRTAWGMAVCWVIFACATGNGGWINDILSWSPYVPLGRLTYCAYLLHPLVIFMYHENRMQPVYYTDYNMVYCFLGHLVMSYGAAFITSLFFESPMMGLEKAIFKK